MKEYKVVVNGEEYLVEIEVVTTKSQFLIKEPVSHKKEEQVLTPKNNVKVKKILEDKVKPSSEGGECVIAPIPGTIFKLEVKEGDQVLKGDVLLILEAMKMENEIVATKSGVVIEIKAKQGASVNVGDILVVIE
ncbi:MAG: biotin/lipoyl-containing protein [Fusobacteriaceae bacterium]